MSREKEARPAVDQAGSGAQITTAACHGSATGSVHAHLRARRAASYRLPPLPEGRRDPLDPPPVPPRLSVESARAAWRHLYHHGLMSTVVEQTLARSIGAAP
ncbi:hypothetical protein [Amycolatopsis aidingensis]|uniref:hypothetical protein n=1 Tax=Amycolatopsis aidingensis TaxID=2842453 RepID=UPI001C0B0F62|nr:hypothetical protein [Amycolatopsis aidingensis]